VPSSANPVSLAPSTVGLYVPTLQTSPAATNASGGTWQEFADPLRQAPRIEPGYNREASQLSPTQQFTQKFHGATGPLPGHGLDRSPSPQRVAAYPPVSSAAAAFPPVAMHSPPGYAGDALDSALTRPGSPLRRFLQMPDPMPGLAPPGSCMTPCSYSGMAMLANPLLPASLLPLGSGMPLGTMAPPGSSMAPPGMGLPRVGSEMPVATWGSEGRNAALLRVWSLLDWEQRGTLNAPALLEIGWPPQDLPSNSGEVSQAEFLEFFHGRLAGMSDQIVMKGIDKMKSAAEKASQIQKRAKAAQNRQAAPQSVVLSEQTGLEATPPAQPIQPLQRPAGKIQAEVSLSPSLSTEPSARTLSPSQDPSEQPPFSTIAPLESPQKQRPTEALGKGDEEGAEGTWKTRAEHAENEVARLCADREEQYKEIKRLKQAMEAMHSEHAAEICTLQNERQRLLKREKELVESSRIAEEHKLRECPANDEELT